MVFAHPSADSHLRDFLFGAIMTNDTKSRVDKELFRTFKEFLLKIEPEIGLLDYIGSLF